MRPRATARAFTLIEVLVVVVVVGILATLAVVGYHRWVLSSYMTEAQDMIEHIRSAEEAFHAENGVYLDVSGGLDSGHMYPADPPGAFKTAWGAACTKCTGPQRWEQLNVQAQAPTIFAYAVTADNTGGTPPALTLTSTAAPDLSALKGNPWYIVEAQADTNGDGVFTRVYAFSSTPQLLVDNEGN